MPPQPLLVSCRQRKFRPRLIRSKRRQIRAPSWMKPILFSYLRATWKTLRIKDRQSLLHKSPLNHLRNLTQTWFSSFKSSTSHSSKSNTLPKSETTSRMPLHQKTPWSNLRTQLRLFKHRLRPLSREKKTKTLPPRLKMILRPKKKSLSTSWKRMSSRLIMMMTKRWPIIIGKCLRLILKGKKLGSWRTLIRHLPRMLLSRQNQELRWKKSNTTWKSPKA